MARRKGRGRVSVQKEVESDRPDSPIEIPAGPSRKSLPVPDDIVLEICTHAHPLDVLFLARTCTTLRSILFRRSSMATWKQTFRNVGLPQCPDDASAPHHVSLFFESFCDSCGTTRCKKSRKDVYWEMGLRFCVKCARKFVSVPAQCPGLPDGELETLVPTSQKSDQTRGKVYQPLLQKIMDTVQSFASLSPAPSPAKIQAFVAYGKNRVAMLDNFAQEAELWNEVNSQEEVDREDSETRQAIICSRLQEEGWGDELELYRKYVLRHPLVDTPKKLFPDDWPLIKKTIQADVTSQRTAEVRRKTLHRKKRERYRRWACAMEVLDDLAEDPVFKDGGVWPDGNDLRRMPLLQPILNGPAEASIDRTSTDGRTAEAASVFPENSTEIRNDDAMNSLRKSELPLDDPASPFEDCHGDDEIETHSVSRHRAVAREASECSEDSFLPDEPRGDDYRDDYLGALPKDDSESEEEDTGKISHYRDEVSAAMRAVFPGALAAWRRDISLQLFDSLSEDSIRGLVGDTDLASDDAKIAFLSRAATVFYCDRSHEYVGDGYTVCGGARRSVLFFPEALEHREVCVFGNGDRLEHFESRYPGPYGDCQKELRVCWSPESIELYESLSELVQQLAHASGLDHLTATRRQMDEADARFVCKTCLDERDGEAVKAHNWLSCLSDQSAGRSHDGLEAYHPADFVRITNPDVEARVRELAPRAGKEEPLSVTVSALGFPSRSLVS